ncbi:MAG TPA: class I SAM-dependent methyltransferase [Thermoleophilaceae bacterium]
MSSIDLDSFEAFYDERYEGDYMSGHGDVEAGRVADTLAACGLPPRPAIVDYGCGRGAWIGALRQAFPGARITGIEISERAVERARLEHPGAEFLAFDGARAPLPDESADLVFSYHVIEHVIDLSETVGDMARLARPGGYVVAIMPCANAGSVENLAARLVAGALEPSSTGEPRLFYDDPGHLRRLTSAQLAAAFAENGCELAGELYARRLAAVGYITAIPGTVRALFDPSRGRTPAAAGVLAAARVAFTGIAALVWAGLQPPERMRAIAAGDPSPARRAAAAAALAARPVARPASRLVQETLPRWEWQRSAHVAHGASAQFLVFRKRA